MISRRIAPPSWASRSAFSVPSSIVSETVTAVKAIVTWSSSILAPVTTVVLNARVRSMSCPHGFPMPESHSVPKNSPSPST